MCANVVIPIHDRITGRKKNLYAAAVILRRPKMRTIILKAVVRLLLVAMLCAGAGSYGYGQSMTQGAISGTVFDSTNAVIPKAAVLIHNDATAADIRLTSGDAGEFRAPQLSPGTYTVTITAPGFSAQKQNRVVVQVNEVTELNPHLTTGSQTTAVEVMAEA